MDDFKFRAVDLLKMQDNLKFLSLNSVSVEEANAVIKTLSSTDLRDLEAYFLSLPTGVNHNKINKDTTERMTQNWHKHQQIMKGI